MMETTTLTTKCSAEEDLETKDILGYSVQYVHGAPYVLLEDLK